LVVGVDLMTKANPGARKSIAVIETRFEADESLAAAPRRQRPLPASGGHSGQESRDVAAGELNFERAAVA
jgi:hypothetical protein